VWIARSIGTSENFNGGVIRPAESFLGNLAIFFGTSNLNSIWKGSSILVRGAWQWMNDGEIFTPYIQLPFNERTYVSLVSLNAQPPFSVEFLVNADIRNYSFSIWEENIGYESNRYTIELSAPQLILPSNLNRDSLLVENGSAQIHLGFTPESLHLSIEPLYTVSLDPGSLGELWGASSSISNVKITEVSKI